MADRLAGIIEKECGIYEDILKIGRNKTDIIVEGKVADLENLVKMEQALVLQVSKLEEEREAVLREIAGIKEGDSSNLTLSAILGRLTGDEAKKLEALQKKIIETVKELQSVNEQNTKLIQQHLEYINFSINMISDLKGMGNAYSNNGKPAEGGKKNFFDAKL